LLVAEIGEEALLKRLRNLFLQTATSVPVGIGDDAAVIRPASGQGILTTDILLEGIHFQRDWQTARRLGRKSLAVNLSDLAAMGATPAYALLSIACSKKTSVDYILDLCQGFCDLALEEKVAVIGGDTSVSDGPLFISVTAGGEVKNGEAVLRSGARVGDNIMVTGFLGSAAAGLKLLKIGAGKNFEELKQAFINPIPRVAAGVLARQMGATAMTDISDGLAGDLTHICDESGVGARIWIDKLPVHPQLSQAAGSYGWNLEKILLQGGEDYELLFTIASADAEATCQKLSQATGIPVTLVGEIIPAEEGIVISGSNGTTKTMPRHGYDHFLL